MKNLVEHVTAITPGKALHSRIKHETHFIILINFKKSSWWRDLIFFFFLLEPYMPFWYSSVRKTCFKFTNPLCKIKHFQSLTDTSEPQREENAISHNTLWHQIRSHKWRADASLCVPIRGSRFIGVTVHSSPIWSATTSQLFST